MPDDSSTPRPPITAEEIELATGSKVHNYVDNGREIMYVTTQHDPERLLAGLTALARRCLALAADAERGEQGPIVPPVED